MMTRSCWTRSANNCWKMLTKVGKSPCKIRTQMRMRKMKMKVNLKWTLRW